MAESVANGMQMDKVDSDEDKVNSGEDKVNSGG